MMGLGQLSYIIVARALPDNGELMSYASLHRILLPARIDSSQLLHLVPAELIAKGREQLVGERFLVARLQSLQ